MPQTAPPSSRVLDPRLIQGSLKPNLSAQLTRVPDTQTHGPRYVRHVWERTASMHGRLGAVKVG